MDDYEIAVKLAEQKVNDIEEREKRMVDDEEFNEIIDAVTGQEVAEYQQSAAEYACAGLDDDAPC